MHPMDGTGVIDAPMFNAPGIDVQSQETASELKVFGHRIESLLATHERGGSCGVYQMQIARGLLGSLLDAIDEMGPVRSRA